MYKNSHKHRHEPLKYTLTYATASTSHIFSSAQLFQQDSEAGGCCRFSFLMEYSGVGRDVVALALSHYVTDDEDAQIEHLPHQTL